MGTLEATMVVAHQTPCTTHKNF